MTTITKEWLQQTIAGFENTRDDIPFGLSDDDAKMLIVLKRALASLTAEPVAWTDAEELRDLRTVGFAKCSQLNLSVRMLICTASSRYTPTRQCQNANVFAVNMLNGLMLHSEVLVQSVR